MSPHLTSTVLAALALLGTQGGAVNRRSTAVQRCAVLKLKATGRAVAGEMRCYADAQARGQGADSGCLATKLAAADAVINKAGAACPGTQPELDDAIIACTNQLHADTSGSDLCAVASASVAGRRSAAELGCAAKEVARSGTFAACEMKEDARTARALSRSGGCIDAATVLTDTDACATQITNLIAFPPTTTTLLGGTTTTTTLPSTLPAVFIIVMENNDWSRIKGSPSAPYINGALLPAGSHAEQYYNPPGIHPSEPNYLWLEAGTNFGVFDDRPPAANHLGATNHLVSLLEADGISWKAYEEDASGVICPLADQGLYAVRHNPFVFFDDVTGANDPHDAYCIAHVRPYSELQADLTTGSVARYNFITPNVCNDMHDSCAPLNNPVKQGDTWLAAEVPKILASQAYADNGTVLIVWDEAETGDGPIGMMVLSPLAKGGGYSNTVRYTHSSTLRTVEEIFGVTPLLNDAANATDLSDLFVTLP